MIFFSTLISFYLVNEITSEQPDNIEKLPNIQSVRTIDIYDNYLTYDKHDGLYIYNLKERKETQIVTKNEKFNTPKIFEKKITWLTDDNIYYYNLDTHEKIKITSDDAKPYNYPSIYGNYIVWQDGRHDDDPYDDIQKDEIYIYNINSNEENRISFSLSNKYRPDIFENIIVWQQNNNSNWSMKIFNLKTGKEIEVEGGANPKIWGDRIFYTTEIAIYYYDFLLEKEYKVQGSESIWGTFDVYEDKSIWEASDELYLYDLSKNKLIPIVEQLGSIEDEYEIWVKKPEYEGGS